MSELTEFEAHTIARVEKDYARDNSTGADDLRRLIQTVRRLVARVAELEGALRALDMCRCSWAERELGHHVDCRYRKLRDALTPKHTPIPGGVQESEWCPRCSRAMLQRGTDGQVVDAACTCEDRPEETPAEHFQRCGPFCTHVTACPECSNIRGACPAHRDNPDGTWVWAKDVET